MKSLKIIIAILGLLFVSAAVSYATTAEAFPTVSSIVEVTMASSPLVFYSANVTPEVIQELRIKFGKLKVITVVAEDAEYDDEGNQMEEPERYQFIVKRPDRGLAQMLLTLAQKREIDKFAEVAVKNLIVGGDTEALKDGLVYMGVVTQLKSMVAPAQAFFSKA